MLSNQDGQEAKQNPPQFDEVDLIVVGAGTGGLTATLEAIHTGKKVLVIEYRDAKAFAVRPQLVYSPITESYLRWKRNLPTELNLEEEDLDLLDKIRTSRQIGVQEYQGIKDIQRFLRNRIDDLDSQSCVFLYNSKVIGINVEQGNLTVVDVRDEALTITLNFKCLFLADGGKHYTAGLLPEFEFKPSEKPQRIHNKHAAAYLTVTSKDGHLIDPIKLSNSGNLITLFDENYIGIIHPEFYSSFKSQQKKLKLYVVMSISDDRFEVFKSNHELGIQYLMHCVASVFNENDYIISMTKSKKNPLSKDPLKFATFTQDFVEANKAAFEKNGHIVALIGDTLYHPDFYIGHGTDFAVLSAEKASHLLTGKAAVSEYNKWCKHYLELRKQNTKEDVAHENFLFTRRNAGIPGVFCVSPFLNIQLEIAIKDLHVFAQPRNELASEIFEEKLPLLEAKKAEICARLNMLANTLEDNSSMRNAICSYIKKVSDCKSELELNKELEALEKEISDPQLSTGQFLGGKTKRTYIIDEIQKLKKELETMASNAFVTPEQNLSDDSATEKQLSVRDQTEFEQKMPTGYVSKLFQPSPTLTPSDFIKKIIDYSRELNTNTSTNELDLKVIKRVQIGLQTFLNDSSPTLTTVEGLLQLRSEIHYLTRRAEQKESYQYPKIVDDILKLIDDQLGISANQRRLANDIVKALKNRQNDNAEPGPLTVQNQHLPRGQPGGA